MFSLYQLVSDLTFPRDRATAWLSSEKVLTCVASNGRGLQIWLI